MVMPNETVFGERTLPRPEKCDECHKPIIATVMRSAGTGLYYIGTECGCGTYSRETEYFKTATEARSLLDIWEASLFRITPLVRKR